MNESRKPLFVALAVAAVLIAGVSAWMVLGSQATSADRNKTTVGPISSHSSMFGPDASGKPRTERPV